MMTIKPKSLESFLLLWGQRILFNLLHGVLRLSKHVPASHPHEFDCSDSTTSYDCIWMDTVAWIDKDILDLFSSTRAPNKRTVVRPTGSEAHHSANASGIEFSVNKSSRAFSHEFVDMLSSTSQTLRDEEGGQNVT